MKIEFCDDWALRTCTNPQIKCDASFKELFPGKSMMSGPCKHLMATNFAKGTCSALANPTSCTYAVRAWLLACQQDKVVIPNHPPNPLHGKTMDKKLAKSFIGGFKQAGCPLPEYVPVTPVPTPAPTPAPTLPPTPVPKVVAVPSRARVMGRETRNSNSLAPSAQSAQSGMFHKLPRKYRAEIIIGVTALLIVTLGCVCACGSRSGPQDLGPEMQLKAGQMTGNQNSYQSQGAGVQRSYTEPEPYAATSTLDSRLDYDSWKADASDVPYV
jgi:hypothetical protein